MNIVLDDAVEIYQKKKSRREIGLLFFFFSIFFNPSLFSPSCGSVFLGRIMLRGDNITLIQAVQS